MLEAYKNWVINKQIKGRKKKNIKHLSLSITKINNRLMTV